MGNKRVLSYLASGIVHVSSSTLGAMISGAWLLYLLYPMARIFHPELKFLEFNRVLSLPYFPLQIGMASVLGYVLARRRPSPLTGWVWLFPLAVLAYGILSYSPSALEPDLYGRMSHFFGSK